MSSPADTADMAYREVRYEVSDSVAVITLNRPRRLNAWTPSMDVELRRGIGAAERDPAVVGIVITGAGRGFCSGADLDVLGALARGARSTGPRPVPGDPSWGDDFRGGFSYLLSVPKPVIAAINGPVAGIGLALALCCDLRIVAEDAVLTTSFAERGAVAELGVGWLLPRLAGPAAALDLLYSARTIDGTEAHRLGLVNDVLATAEVLPAARNYVAELARRCAPRSLAAMKRQVYRHLHAGLGAAEREANDLMWTAFDGQDFAEGVAAFRQGRAPRFARYAAEYPLGSDEVTS